MNQPYASEFVEQEQDLNPRKLWAVEMKEVPCATSDPSFSPENSVFCLARPTMSVTNVYLEAVMPVPLSSLSALISFLLQ